MKSISLNKALCAVLLLAGVWANAREQMNVPRRANTTTQAQASFKTEAGDCVTPTAQFDLDINNVRARLLTGGDMWWNLSEARYEVPKGDGTGASLNAIFSGTIWITGKDFGGQLKCAATRYRQQGDDFWPGPIFNGTTDKATCNKYDRFFNVWGADIEKAQTAFLQKGASGMTLNDVPKSLLSWPAKGNTYLASDPTLVGETFNIEENLAPFKDVDGDGLYDPLKGDFPYIPCRKDPTAQAYADQMVFWTINDVGNQHTESNGIAIGAQINCLAFAFQTTDDVNNMTFYKYEIVNKTSNPLYQTYISQNVDPDLGCFSNDAIGCDTTRSLGVVYNRTATDNDCQGVSGYGSELPLLGIDFFEGPLGDNGEQLGISSFIYYTNGGTFDNDPSNAAQYRNYQEALWIDGAPFTFGGTGRGSGSPTKFVYPGNPAIATEWSEVSANTQMGDRRFAQTTGPFTLTPGVGQYVTVGAVFVRPAGGVGLSPNFATTIGPADDLAQALFNTCFKLVDGPAAPTLNIRESNKEVVINLVNEVGSNNFGEKYNEVDGKVAQEVYSKLGGNGDSTYTFEGYKLYQLANPRVSATELNDPTKAYLIAQVDVKNGVGDVINFVKSGELGGLYDPIKMVDGADEGIKTSFKITEDYFSTAANKQLVNHKTYYYTAVAYAYNNYIPYDQLNPTTGGQLTPYLQGRLNFKVYSAIPHQQEARNNGTVTNSTWGEGVEVKRIEGRGNGANGLRLTPETVERIIGSGLYAFADTLTYEKGFDPIGFKVTDPIALKEADFEMQFDEDTFLTVVAQVTYSSGTVDTVTYRNVRSDFLSPLDSMAEKLRLPQGAEVTDTLSTSPTSFPWKWILTDLTNNVKIPSDRYNDRPYEQHIVGNDGSGSTEYGFSIKLGTPAPVHTLPGNYLASNNSPERYVYGALPSSIEYANPLEQWLSFVKDEGVNAVSNWIRAGKVLNDPNSDALPTKAAAESFDDNWYYTTVAPPSSTVGNSDTKMSDSTETFETMADGRWAPYCLAANYAKKNLSTTDVTAGKPPFVYGPGFKWRNYAQSTPPQNTLDRLVSVDIVITPDQSKWSRCVVFETGEDEAINDGDRIAPNGKKARKGQIRMEYSKNWNNRNPNNPDYLVVDQSDTGRSWFPGYAVNVETGERLNIAFGESSDMTDQNGNDMLWNPTTNVYSPIVQPNQVIPQLPYFGGKHFIYVMESRYDEGQSVQRQLLDNYTNISGNAVASIPAALYPVYRGLMWTSIPYLTPGYSFANDGNGNKIVPPAEVKVRLRVEKPFGRQLTTSWNGIDSLPRYQFSTKGKGATENNTEVAKTALDEIRVVPNPYLAYSTYETDQNTNRIKITNLPNTCSVTILALDGTIIRKLSRAIDVDPATNKKIEISDGTPISDVNLDNTLEWDLKNEKGITISSGIYLFQVEAPGLGQRTVKWFGAVRPADTSNF